MPAMPITSPAADERQLDLGPVAPAQVLVALELREARVCRDVRDDQRLSPVRQRVADRGCSSASGYDGADVLVVDGAVGSMQATQRKRIAVDRVDVAVGRIGGGAEPVRHAQAGWRPGSSVRAELEPGLDEQAEHARWCAPGARGAARSRPLPASDLRGAHEEVAILGVVTLAVVVDVEQADHAVSSATSGTTDLAARAGLPVQVALVIRSDADRPARR